MNKADSKSKTGFYVAVGCPGCGGELELGENFFVLTCRYCNSTLRIAAPDEPPAYLVAGRVSRREIRFTIDRHLRQRSEPLTAPDTQFKRIYYPYWKVDAILLKTRNRAETIERVNEYADEYGGAGESTNYTVKKTDVSLTPYTVTFPAGIPLDGIPPTLGSRASYIKARPFAPENIEEGFKPLAITVDWPTARRRAVDSVANVGRIDTADFGKNRTEMFRPRGSIVYFPYYLAESFSGGYRRWICDAVTGRVVGFDDVMDDAGDVPERAAIEFGQLKIDLHRCGNCGHDLPGRQSYLYICHHCERIHVIEPHPLLRSEISVTEPSGGRDDRLLPFWRLTLSPEVTARLKAFTGGLGRAATLAIPAFRVNNFEAAYRLSRRLSTAASGLTWSTVTEPDNRFVAADISPSEALVLARAVVSREILALSSSIELPQITDAFNDMALCYVPFHQEHYFFLDSVLNAVSVEKNLVPA